MRRAALAALLATLLAAALAQDATCNFGSVPFAPQSNRNMPDCCWYRNSTCCAGSTGRLFPIVRTALDNYAEHKVDGECFTEIANFMCVFCHPSFGTFLTPLAPGHYKLTLCPSFCSALFASCDKVQWGDLLPEKPANAADLCKMLFEASVQAENADVSYAIDIADDTQCFAGAPVHDVLCSGCLQGSRCAPSMPPMPPKPPGPPGPPRRHPVRPPSAAITVAIVVLSGLLCLGAVAVCRYFMRAYAEGSGARRGRDFYPSTGEADTEAINA